MAAEGKTLPLSSSLGYQLSGQKVFPRPLRLQSLSFSPSTILLSKYLLRHSLIYSLKRSFVPSSVKKHSLALLVSRKSSKYLAKTQNVSLADISSTNFTWLSAHSACYSQLTISQFFGSTILSLTHWYVFA